LLVTDVHVPPTAQSGAHSTTAGNGLFARNATGLVREVTPVSAYILNIIGGHPVQPLAYGLFFAFALFPGGSFLLGGVLAIPIAISFSYAFGLMTAMMPRTGGDYTIVSRTINPLVGLISSFCQTVSNLLSVCFFGTLIVTLGVGPGLIGIGLVSGSHGLIHFGQTVQGSNWWKLLFATFMYLGAAAMHSGGWRFTMRAQAVVFTIVTGGLVACGVIALFTPHGTFVHNFNNFAAPYTHTKDTYDRVIHAAQHAGVKTNSSFSFKNTIPIVGIFAQFSIFAWFSSFIGGELRQGRSTKTAHMMALGAVTAIVGVLIFAAIFLHTFGTSFLTAANSSTGLGNGLETAPVYFFLISASTGSTIVTVLLVASYLLFWVMLSYFVFTQPSRTLFAYAFDGILPQAVTRVSRKRHVPYVALIVTVLLTEAFLVYSFSNSKFYQVIVYATLIQVISMSLVGVSAAVVPWRRPELYTASVTKRRVLGLPVVSWAGITAVASGIFIWVLYFIYADQYSLTNTTGLWLWVGGTILAAILFYFGARAVKARQGIDLNLTYAEIPPE
jgi:basic amino acid/polyamine antiporter, APA family